MRALSRRVLLVGSYLFCLIAGMVIGRTDAQDDVAAPKEPAANAGGALLKRFDAEFIDVKPGTKSYPKSFRMGADDGDRNARPARDVMMTAEFSMAKYEVPQELYEAVMGENPSVWGGPRNSVEMVSWIDAKRFCARATLLMQQAGIIGKDELIRLPTEAEWEYCCRAGTKTAFSFGDSATASTDRGDKASLLDPYGWHTGNAAGNDPPVGALKPNAWGFYDMHGYLWEYVEDEFHLDFADAPRSQDAWVSESGRGDRVMRGGSWRDRYSRLSSVARASIPNHVKSDAIGFRCVKSRRRAVEK